MEVHPLVLKVVQLKAEAGQLGFFKTMHALEEAVKAVGWELADKIEKDNERKNVSTTR